MSKLEAGVGVSMLENSLEAGREAARQAIFKLNGVPQVLVVFAAMRFDHRKLLDGILGETGNIPLVGGTTAGEISSNGFSTQSVVVLAMRSEELSFTTGIGLNMSNNEITCSKNLVQNLRENNSFDQALSLLIFPNGMGGDGTKIIEGLKQELGDDFEIVGGYLGDDERFENTYQYFNGKVFKDAMPGLLVSNNNGYKTGIGVRSGFESIGNRFYCTESEGNVVKQFDNEPALNLYKEFLGEERSKRLPGICLEYPFGLIDEKAAIAGKEYFQIRCGLAVDHQQGTLTLAASIPEGSAITLTTASRGDIINGAKLAAKQALSSMKGARPGVIFMFSCVGRKLVLGRRIQEEVEAVKEILGKNIPLIGFYTYGEIGPINKIQKELKVTKFHNETVVLWVLGNECPE